MFMKTHTIRIAIGQINATVGALRENCDKIRAVVNRARGFGVEIIAFPELAVTGYPPEDLLHKPRFVHDARAAVKHLSLSIDKDIAVIAGCLDTRGKNVFNAAALMHNGGIAGMYHKILLPNYGVFDEKRYFSAGEAPCIFRYDGCIFGITICEDVWHTGPVRMEAQSGARTIFNINASPYHAGKIREREAVVRRQARSNGVSVVYANLVGGQDELVFDGQSMVVNAKGEVLARAEAFKEDLLVVDLKCARAGRRGRPCACPNGASARVTPALIAIAAAAQQSPLPKRDVGPLDPVAEVYQALLLGLRDYVIKNGFQKVVVGLSGGIDSALAAALAVDALGKENVIGVFMPSQYSSRESEEDARRLAENLGSKFIKVSIEHIYKMYLMSLEPHFLGSVRNVTEENLQARIRGNLLMAFSNKFGWLVLTTGNKSEMSTGYATLYGDMAGGFAVIKDVPKMLVYKLSRYRNALGMVIPERILVKEPTAELRPGQKDTDTLPPYDILDPILKAYVEEDKDSASIRGPGFDRAIVERVAEMVDKSEYKRRQAPPGIKITPKAFGRDRRMPITNKYKG